MRFKIIRYKGLKKFKFQKSMLSKFAITRVVVEIWNYLNDQDVDLIELIDDITIYIQCKHLPCAIGIREM